MTLTRRDAMKAAGVGLAGLTAAAVTGRAGKILTLPVAGASGPLAVLGGQTVTLAPGTHVHNGVVIEPGGKLVFPQGQTCVLESDANVICEGDLVMKVGNTAYTEEHVLRFVNVDEAGFVGGGMDPVASDVGLWIMGAGRITAKGSVRDGWFHAPGSLNPGDSVPSAPGWQFGDEVYVAPMTPPRKPGQGDERGHAGDYEVGVVGGACAVAHPAVQGPDGVWRTAEVVNITNNCRIEGTPGGRSHIFVRSTGRQRLQNVTLRHLGVPVGGSLTSGRYAFHLHHCGDGSRDSFLHEVVALECGNHAFVPHVSHGVTFARCAAVETVGSAYWWDPNDETHDTLWDHCIGAGTDCNGENTVGVFTYGEGLGNTAPGCVGVGWYNGGSDLTAHHWPSKANKGPALWAVPDILAHNGQGDGIFVWQNTGEAHHVVRPVMYHCARSGIDHGAYRNPYRYDGAVCFGNGMDPPAHPLDNAALLLHATSKMQLPPGSGTQTQTWNDPQLDGGIGAAIRCLHHAQPPEQPVVFTGGRLVNDGTEALVVVREPEAGAAEQAFPTWVDFVGVDFAAPLDRWFYLTPGYVHEDTLLIVAGVCEVRPSASGIGVPKPEWGDALVMWL